MSRISWTFWVDDEGQDLAEYGLLGALIAVVCALAISTFGQELRDLYESIRSDFPAVG
jgi:Flp pilus assembly pilin Flp